MFFKYSSYLKNFDWPLFAAALFLVLFGLLAIYSVALSQPSAIGCPPSIIDCGEGAGSALNLWNFKKQALFGVIGFIILFAASMVNYKLWKTYGWVFYGAILILLGAVLLWGQTLRGTTGWFAIRGFTFQPVELAKPALIIILAKYFSQSARTGRQLRYLTVSALLTLGMLVLIILQPDLGSAALLIILWFCLLLTAGIRYRHLLGIIFISVLLVIFSWNFILQDYQKSRIQTFLNPMSDPLGQGYNVIQSVIAVGGGRLIGSGLGFGSQSQLKFLPEAQTDFIFAVIAEELGFVGVSLFLVLWIIVFYRLIKIAKKARDDFELFLVLGIAILFFIQLIISVGMNMGLLPVTGITLPLVSYGGSSLLVSLLMLGIAQSVAWRE